jgi:hypothetical protein
MLFGEALVLNRQLESGEFDHPAPGRNVFFIKGRFRRRTGLAHRPAILPVLIRVKVTITAGISDFASELSAKNAG